MSEKQTHTPGPWRVTEDANGFAVSWLNSPGLAGRIAKVNSGQIEQEANAHLIAAAPELLKALVAIVAVADRKTAEFDLARAAIAKARGTTP